VIQFALSARIEYSDRIMEPGPYARIRSRATDIYEGRSRRDCHSACGPRAAGRHSLGWPRNVGNVLRAAGKHESGIQSAFLGG
jgi:hypothetical protein